MLRQCRISANSGKFMANAGGASQRINSLILRTVKRVESVECDSPPDDPGVMTRAVMRAKNAFLPHPRPIESPPSLSLSASSPYLIWQWQRTKMD